jgi:hypothetical protein
LQKLCPEKWIETQAGIQSGNYLKTLKKSLFFSALSQKMPDDNVMKTMTETRNCRLCAPTHQNKIL